MEYEKIREVIAEQMSIDIEKINLDTSFRDDLNADSLDLFQVITELEEVFGMEMSTDDIEKIKTVGDAVAYVKKAVSQ
jgi:acyl carrier protein